MANLVSPGVSVTVEDRSAYAETQPITIPLIIFATRKNKMAPDGSKIATGTAEANKLRMVFSQRELVQNYGLPVFVTSNGAPVHGEETNEYGLLAAYSFLGRSQSAFVMRADIDLSNLVPTSEEPSLPPADNTYWVNPEEVVGGIFQFDGTNWVEVPFTVYTKSPTVSDGNDGDWAFDLSTVDARIVFKQGGNWLAATAANVAAAYSGAVFHIEATTPTAPASGDFWYKTSSSGGGSNWNLRRYRAADGVFVTVPVVRSDTAPVPSQDTIWEDTSQILNDGSHPLKIGTGASFVDLTYFAQTNAPDTEPETGTPWYDDTITDFAMYVEGTDVGRGNEWVPVTTTTVSNPSRTQKVISASPPSLPQDGAIWIDVSTPENLDKFPIVKKWISGQWLDITESVRIGDSDPIATVVPNGTYWINTGEIITRNIVKIYDPDYVPVKVELNTSTGKYEVVNIDNWKWRPQGKVFGRRSVRGIIVQKLQEAIQTNQEIRSEGIRYQLIACPGYPELYDEMNALNSDIGETAFVVADTPKFMSPYGTAIGREITVAEWVSNSRNVTVTGEEGFGSARSPYAGFWYPWGMATNLDGNNVMVPPSHMVLRSIAYSDTVSAPWFPPAGLARGRVDNVTSVGYLNNDGKFVTVALSNSMRDSFYTNDVNPITFQPSFGLVIFGQKSFAASSTALDRINVSRLVAKMKSDLRILMAAFLFELNDATTRRSARQAVERYLSGLLAGRALYDFAVRCDENNNPPDVIDRNELYVDVLIKPAKSIEFIYVPIKILNTGDALEF